WSSARSCHAVAGGILWGGRSRAIGEIPEIGQENPRGRPQVTSACAGWFAVRPCFILGLAGTGGSGLRSVEGSRGSPEPRESHAVAAVAAGAGGPGTPAGADSRLHCVFPRRRNRILHRHPLRQDLCAVLATERGPVLRAADGARTPLVGLHR